MRKNIFFIGLLIGLFAFNSCSREQTVAPISIRWEMGQNNIEPGYYENTFYITNTSKKALDKNWVLYFCQFPAIPQIAENSPFIVEKITSSYHKLYPSDNYLPIPAGETVAFVFRCRGNITKERNAPEGAFLVLHDDSGKDIGKPLDVAIRVMPFTHEYQWSRPGSDEIPYPSGDIVYEQNSLFQEKTELQPSDILPALKSVNQTPQQLHLTQHIQIIYDSAFANEADLLKEKLQDLYRCTVSDQGETRIALKTLTPKETISNTEYYEIDITNQGIEIRGITPHAVFNGTQTLLAMLGNYGNLPCNINGIQIRDYPDLEYRGLMLDVARNFTKKENVLKLIDLLSAYKMNVFHFHLGDDEGWRLEIPGLEELTTTGAHRGYTIDETNCLFPQYGSGWDQTNTNSLGNGYYSRKDFIEILQYANRRHIRVIPEFDLPGHSRAAIKAMNARYKKYKDTDRAKAEEYLLIDFQDTSKYYSAQAYTDNVMNVAMPSVYRFVNKVVDEVAAIYQEAGLTLPVIHLGGDEVPHGAWEGSPLCKAFMNRQGMTEIRELKDYFLEQVIAHLKEKNMQLAAWQEVVLLPDGSANKRFEKSNVLSYCWNTIPEWGDDHIPYQLANAGYPVILCNVSNFYLDMAYNKHPSEPGLYWGGFVNEYTSFDMLPYSIYKSLRYNRKGQPVDIEAAQKSKLALNKNAVNQIKGIQGQLWAETIRSYDMIERALFPKMFGLIERAWNTQPAWEKDDALYKEALIRYNAQIASHELPNLAKRGVNFRIAQPGIKMVDGKLYANSTIPQAIIRYTTDGSEPTADSPVWTNPVECQAPVVKAKSYYLDKESVTTLLKR